MSFHSYLSGAAAVMVAAALLADRDDPFEALVASMFAAALWPILVFGLAITSPFWITYAVRGLCK